MDLLLATSTASNGQLIASAIIGVALVLGLIIGARMQAFVALLIGAVTVGLLAGMDAIETFSVIKKGMGGTLGFVAIAVGLGAMLGAILQVTGAAEKISSVIIDTFGDKYAGVALGISGLIIAIPVFFDVALIILLPIAIDVSRRTGRSIFYYAIPMLAGIAIGHAFIPPTPGPLLVAELLGADIGDVILYGLIVAIPTFILSGLVLGKFLGDRMDVKCPDMTGDSGVVTSGEPSFLLSLFTVLLPLILVLTATFVSNAEMTGGFAEFLIAIGDPIAALLISVVFAMIALGYFGGLSREDLEKLMTKSLAPAGLIILVTGAGGAFKQVMVDSGVGAVIGEGFADLGIPLVVVAFVIALFVRIAVGSATAAMTMAAGLVAPIALAAGASSYELALCTMAIASGSTAVSHVNDSGFWLVKEYLGMDTKQTLKSWTVMETVVGFSGFAVVLVLSIFA